MAEGYVRILEVSAVPPRMFMVSQEDMDKLGLLDTVKSGLAYFISNIGRKTQSTDPDLLLLSDPIPRQMPYTVMTTYDMAGHAHEQTLGTLWFLENKNITDANTNYNVTWGSGDRTLQTKGDLLTDLTAANMQNNALNYWEIPIDYVNTVKNGNYDPTEDGVHGYVNVNNKLLTGSITYAPPITVYNNKARYFQSVRLKVYSVASGDSIEKNIFDPLPITATPNTPSYSLPYVVSADIRPDGYPLFLFKYDDGGGDQRLRMTEFIKGGNWRRVPLTNNQLPGAYFSRLQLRNQMGNAGMAALGAIGGGLIAGISGGIEGMANVPNWLATQGNGIGARNLAGGFIKGAVGAVPDIMKQLAIPAAIGTYNRMLEQQQLLNRQGICAASPQFINNSDFIKNIDKNGFQYVITRYCDADMVAYDAFLEKFGYNVGNMMIGTQHFYSRKHFVFMQINDATIASEKFSNQEVQECIDLLKTGVRIWRTKPSIDKMNPGGNHERNEEVYNV